MIPTNFKISYFCFKFDRKSTYNSFILIVNRSPPVASAEAFRTRLRSRASVDYMASVPKASVDYMASVPPPPDYVPPHPASRSVTGKKTKS